MTASSIPPLNSIEEKTGIHGSFICAASNTAVPVLYLHIDCSAGSTYFSGNLLKRVYFPDLINVTIHLIATKQLGQA